MGRQEVASWRRSGLGGAARELNPHVSPWLDNRSVILTLVGSRNPLQSYNYWGSQRVFLIIQNFHFSICLVFCVFVTNSAPNSPPCSLTLPLKRSKTLAKKTRTSFSGILSQIHDLQSPGRWFSLKSIKIHHCRN